MVIVSLPTHLRTLAQVSGDIDLDLPSGTLVTQNAILDTLEQRYPMLRGTIRDHVTKERRAFIRFFACNEDVTHDPVDKPLPDSIASGAEPFLIVGAIAGG